VRQNSKIGQILFGQNLALFSHKSSQFGNDLVTDTRQFHQKIFSPLKKHDLAKVCWNLVTIWQRFGH
jgi:hypothetical protein